MCIIFSNQLLLDFLYCYFYEFELLSWHNLILNSIGVKVQSTLQLRRTVVRWIRDIKKRMTTTTGQGRQKPLAEYEEILVQIRLLNKKSLDKNARVSNNTISAEKNVYYVSLLKCYINWFSYLLEWWTTNCKHWILKFGDS